MLYALGVALVVACVYAKTIPFGFVDYDDQIHVYQNPGLNPPTWASLASFWTHSYQYLYIPVSYTVYALLAWVSNAISPHQAASSVGLDPHIFHAANVTFAALNAALLFTLLRRLFRNDAASAIGALLYTVHPLQVESVAWVSEMRGLVSTTFALLACIVHTRVHNDEPSSHSKLLKGCDLVLCAILATAAMLAKPSAVGLPVILFGLELLRKDATAKSSLLRVMPSVVIAAVVVFATHGAQTVPASMTVAPWLRGFVAGDAVAFYCAKLLVPIRLAADYGRDPVGLMRHAWAYAIWIVPAAMGIAAYRARRRAPWLASGAVVALGALLPNLGLVPFIFQASSTVADRYASFALVGVAIAVAGSLDAARSRAMNVAAAVLLCVLALVAVRQQEIWRDSESLYTATLAVNPTSYPMLTGLADIKARRGDYVGAARTYSVAIDAHPSVEVTYLQRADCYLKAGDLEAAIADNMKVATSDPNCAAAFDGLAAVYAAAGQRDKALALYRHALMIDPHDPKAAQGVRK
jgi:Tfp pilus assembly protein PilF